MYIMCVILYLFSALSRRVGALQMSIIIIIIELPRCLVVTWLVPRETAVVSAHVLCTSYSVMIMMISGAAQAGVCGQGAHLQGEPHHGGQGALF